MSPLTTLSKYLCTYKFGQFTLCYNRFGYLCQSMELYFVLDIFKQNTYCIILFSRKWSLLILWFKCQTQQITSIFQVLLKLTLTLFNSWPTKHILASVLRKNEAILNQIPYILWCDFIAVAIFTHLGVSVLYVRQFLSYDGSWM